MNKYTISDLEKALGIKKSILQEVDELENLAKKLQELINKPPEDFLGKQ